MSLPFLSEPVVQFGGRKDDPVVKGGNKLRDFLHMFLTIGTAQKGAAGFQHPCNFRAGGGDVIAVKKEHGLR